MEVKRVSVKEKALNQKTRGIVPRPCAQYVLLHPGLQPFPAPGLIHVPAVTLTEKQLYSHLCEMAGTRGF